MDKELLRRKKISKWQENKYDLTGKKFGRLYVLSTFVKNKVRFSHCICDCGKEINVRCFNLKSGKTKSCGCLLKERYNKNGGISKGLIYNIWNAMKQRCYNPKTKCYKRYGGRGINICKEWLDYFNFENWALKNGYKTGLTIDRIDVNGNYCQENCRWMSLREQARNKRNNRFIEFNNEKKPLIVWCEELDLSYSAVVFRLNNGWSIEKALTKKTPTGFKYQKRRKNVQKKYGRKATNNR